MIPPVKLAKALPSANFRKTWRQAFQIYSSLHVFVKDSKVETKISKTKNLKFLLKYRWLEGTAKGSGTDIQNAGEMPVLTMAPESRFEIVKYRVVSPILKMGDVQLGCFLLERY